MQRVKLIENPLEPGTWENLECADVRELLVERFATWPATARIYAGPVGDDNDVTPICPDDVERLPGYGELTVIVFPEHVAALLIIAIVIAVVATVALMFLLPAIPDLSNQQTPSPNNALSDRTNRARPNARIPDIYGTLRSVPDLLTVPYRVYDDHHELEISYMCIGRGAYDVEDVRDGDTLVENIAGTTVEVYGPGTSPNSGDPPELLIGLAISDPLFNVSRLNEVNGQVLKAPNDVAVRADNEISFADGGVIHASGGEIDFTEYFEPGDVVTIGRASDSGTVADASAIFALATAVYPDTLRFDSYDPLYHWTAGQNIVVMGATYSHSADSPGAPPTTGDVDGYEYNPDYPIEQIP